MSAYKRKNKKSRRSSKKGRRVTRQTAPSSRWKRLRKLLLIYSLVFISIFCCFLFYCLRDLPDATYLASRDHKPMIRVYSENDELLVTYGDSHVKNLVYSSVPRYVIEALIATEDRRFFSHYGIDLRGILRAQLANIASRRIVQGGSTLTQQLSKIIFLSPDRSIKRKVQEAVIALQLERRFSKEQILVMYLNRAYWGKGNYGLTSASRYYFNKDPLELTTYEAAVLVGMLKAPSRYSNSTEKALLRGKQVLLNMAALDYIEEDDIHKLETPRFSGNIIHRGKLQNPYFGDYVMEEAQKLIGKFTTDINIYTTLDYNLQEISEHILVDTLSKADKSRNVTQGAVFAMEKGGAIKAMVGGTSYSYSKFNRVNLAMRQPGSAFKLFIYLAALEAGYGVHSIFNDQEINIDGWSPKNYANKDWGKVSMIDAFAYSVNRVAVYITEFLVGRKRVIEMAHRLGVRSHIDDLPSISLGTSLMSLMELTTAYAHIANDGVAVQPFSILQITDGNSNVLYKMPKMKFRHTIATNIAQKMKKLLRASIDYGTGKRAGIFSSIIYGKTGTSQSNRDAWFVGFDEYLTLGVWVGNDDDSPMRSITGGMLPASIYHDIIAKAPQVSYTGDMYSLSIFDIFK